MEVLVTGGTGFVGRAVVARLLAAGHRVRVLVRKRRKKFLPRAEQAEGSLSDPAALDRACQGADAVVHLVGIIAEGRGRTFEAVHREGTRAVLAAAERAGVSRYLHMSALGADPASNARYQRTKGEAEALVRASALSWTIFQPSIVFGPGDQFVNQFARLLRFPFNLLQAYSFPLIGGGGTLFQPVAVEDVAEAFARALERPETAGKTYVLAGAERVSLREILEEVARLTGQRRVVEEAPFLLTLRLLLWAGVAAVLMAVLVGQSFSPRGAALWVFAYGIALAWRQLIFFRLPWKAAEAAGAVFEKILPKPPLTRDQVLMLRRDNVGDATPAERDLGLAWRPFRAGIAAYLPGRR